MIFKITSEQICLLVIRTEEEFAKDPNAYEMTNLFLFGAKYRR